MRKRIRGISVSQAGSKRLRAGSAMAACAALALVAWAPSAATAVPAPEPGTGVYGTVTLVPNPCPFYGCDGTPLGATVVARRDGRIVARTQTGRGGRYSLDLRRGTYVLAASPWSFRWIPCDRERVYVPRGKRVRVDIFCHDDHWTRSSYGSAGRTR